MEINLKKVSVVFIIIGIVYIIAGSVIATLWEYIIREEWGIVMLVEGVVLILTACSLLIKSIQPQRKLIVCFIIGYLTAFIGVLITFILNKKGKNQENNNKYDELEKLKKLMDEGVITEEEFKSEKNKLLN